MRIHASRWLASLGILALAATAAPAARAADEPGGTPWLGVYTQELTPELRDGLGHEGDGVLVSRVVPESPADLSGIRKGDIIVRLDSRSVASPGDLSRLVRGMRVGEEALVVVLRDGERRTLRVRLGARPGSVERAPEARRSRGEAERDRHEAEEERERHEQEHRRHFEAPEPPEPPEAPEPPEGRREKREFSFEIPEIDVPELRGNVLRTNRARLGVRIESLNRQLGEYFDVPEGQGVLIVEVMDDTPARRGGLKAGDIIVRVGDRRVNDADDLIRALADEEGRVSITVIRRGDRRTLDVELAPREETRVLRLRRPDGPLRWNTPGNRRLQLRTLDPKEREDMRRELRELQEELRELKKEMEELRNQ